MQEDISKMKTFNNKSEILNRIKIGLNIKNDADLARLLEISPATLSNWRSRNSIDYDMVFSKCEFLNLDWLLTGKGEMLKSEDTYINNADDDLVTIPVVDVEGAAGQGFFNQDYPEKTGEIKLPASMLSRRTGNYYCGLVHGDSMHPTLLDRDHIIFRTLHPGEWELIRDGEVYFIVDRFGKAYVKRVINKLREENRLICMSDNKEGNSNFNMMGDEIGSVYHVECRFSNNMGNLNAFTSSLREDIEMIKSKLKHL
ncbi:MAG: helix-turn-helix domain-containing protein [Bacteroidales bacterium]|nr:helix-turn-helix domain-containing protein [Bacteroidales bacterium]